jgi:hypothetical protein
MGIIIQGDAHSFCTRLKIIPNKAAVIYGIMSENYNTYKNYNTHRVFNT